MEHVMKPDRSLFNRAYFIEMPSESDIVILNYKYVNFKLLKISMFFGEVRGVGNGKMVSDHFCG